MEKEIPPPESLASVTIKADYPPSEMYSSEPPPAYPRHKPAAVQVAKIIAVTVVLVSVVLGGCMLASAYITANASCKHLEEELQLLTESMDRYAPLQPEALIQEEPKQQTVAPAPLETHETNKVKEIKVNNVGQEDTQEEQQSEDSDSTSSSEDSDDEDRLPIQIKLPIQLDFDDLAGAMMEKNQRSKMNCVVEKKRAEEVVDHQPKTVNLPFGVNLTTDPRYERISGERIAIFCESGNVQKAIPQQDREETIMIQPVMIPLPPPQFHTHMPMQAQPMHPMEAMRPPMVNPMYQMQQQQQQQQQQPQEEQQEQESQNQLPPNAILQHIAQQIIAEKLKQEAERNQEEVQNNELRPEMVQRTPLQRINVHQPMARIPIPEEILTQLNRLPNRDNVIVAVSESDSGEEPENLRVIQHQRSSAQGMNGRQSYARGLPVNIPVPMMQQVQESESESEPEASASEENRHHFMQPRSIRSVDALLPAKSQKRVKRCNCDCAC